MPIQNAKEPPFVGHFDNVSIFHAIAPAIYLSNSAVEFICSVALYVCREHGSREASTHGRGFKLSKSIEMEKRLLDQRSLVRTLVRAVVGEAKNRLALKWLESRARQGSS